MAQRKGGGRSNDHEIFKTEKGEDGGGEGGGDWATLAALYMFLLNILSHLVAQEKRRGTGRG